MDEIFQLWGSSPPLGAVFCIVPWNFVIFHRGPGDSSRDLFIPKRWRSLNPLKGSLNHTKKVTLNHLGVVFVVVSLPLEVGLCGEMPFGKHGESCFFWVKDVFLEAEWSFVYFILTIQIYQPLDVSSSTWTTIDGSEIRQTHQLRLVVYPIIYRVLSQSQVEQDFWTINTTTWVCIIFESCIVWHGGLSPIEQWPVRQRFLCCRGWHTTQVYRMMKSYPSI